MKESKKIVNTMTIFSIIGDILLLLLGSYFALNPTISASFMGYMFGIALIITGVYNSIKYVVNFEVSKFFINSLIYGIISILAGIIIVFNPFSFANIVSIMLGIWLIISSIFRGTLVWQLKKYNEEIWPISLTISLLTLILGILVLINPFESYLLLTTFIGILIACYAASDILQQLLFRKRLNEIIKIFYR